MNSVAANPESKTYAYEAGCRAIQEHYRRVGIEAEVEMTKHPGWYRSHVKIQGEPLVSILIPNKDHIDDLEKPDAGAVSRLGNAVFDVESAAFVVLRTQTGACNTDGT